MSEENYSVLVETIGHSPTSNIGISVRHIHATSTSYVFYMDYHYGTYYIYRFDSFYSGVLIGSTLSFPGGFDYLTPYWVRFECVADNLRAKVWEGGSGDEPADWMIVRVDDTYLNNGCIGIESNNLYGANHCTEFDNVVVTAPLSLESTTWGAIKNSF